MVLKLYVTYCLCYNMLITLSLLHCCVCIILLPDERSSNSDASLQYDTNTC